MKRSFLFRCSCVCAGLLLLIGGAILGLIGLMQHASNPSPSPNLSSSDHDYQTDESGFPSVDWKYWLEINPDIVGWITVPGTRINHPIVQAPADDPSYYLHHDLYRHFNLYGVPYLDAACAEYGLLWAPNAIVFGHHMNDGSQFSDVASCFDESYARNHQTLLVQTPSGAKRIYHIRCVRIIPGSSDKCTSFTSRDSFLQWYTCQLDASCVVLDRATMPTRVMTLVTCSYHYSSNERTLVIASEQN